MYKSEYFWVWNVENFSFCPQKTGDFLGSPDFEFGGSDNFRGYLVLYPKGENMEAENFISCRVNSNIEFYWDYEVTVIGASGETLQIHKNNDIPKIGGRLCLSIPKLISIKKVVQDAERTDKDTFTVCLKFHVKNPDNDVSYKCIANTKIGVDRQCFNLKVNIGECAKRSIYFESSPLIEFSITETHGGLQIVSNIISRKPCFVDCYLTMLSKRGKYSHKAKHFFDPNAARYWEFPTTMFSKVLHRNSRDIINSSYQGFKGTVFLSFYCEFSFSVVTSVGFRSFPFASESTLFPDVKDDNSSSPATATSIMQLSLQEDLHSLFHNKKFSDVKLQVDKQIIEAHKNILVARSPVFAAMFDHDMAEAQTGIVDILDMDAGILKLFLQFLYTDTVQEMDHEVASNLLLAAEKYQVLALKEKCAMFLRNEISEKNVCDILTLAETVNHVDLKESSIDFIVAHSAEVLSSPHWSTFAKNNIESASIIFSKLSSYFSRLKVGK